jgi:hypothetical protein
MVAVPSDGSQKYSCHNGKSCQLWDLPSPISNAYLHGKPIYDAKKRFTEQKRLERLFGSDTFAWSPRTGRLPGVHFTAIITWRKKRR